MKRLFIVLSIISLFSCSRTEFSKKETYSGTFTQYRYNSYSDLTDTIVSDIRIKFDNNKFVILDTEENEGCNGQFNTKKSDQLNFESDECSCWCDCHPAIDCAGNALLGNYEITLDSDNKLNFERNWTYDTSFGNEVSIDYILDLEKE